MERVGGVAVAAAAAAAVVVVVVEVERRLCSPQLLRVL
jgi:hypothetical protein